MDLRVIIENGTNFTKAGFSNYDSPVVSSSPMIFSSSKNEFVQIYSTKTTFNSYLREKFYSKIFLDKLRIDPSNLEYVITESVLDGQESRLSILQSMFETFGASKVALASEPTMSLFSSLSNKPKNKTLSPKLSDFSCLIVDLGHMQTTIVPIIEGHIIENGVVISPLNGISLRNFIRQEILRLNPGFIRKHTTNELNSMSQKILESNSSLNFIEINESEKVEVLKLEFQNKVFSKAIAN